MDGYRIDRAAVKKAATRLCWDRTDVMRAAKLSEGTMASFWNDKSLSKKSMKKIVEAVGLEWEDVLIELGQEATA